MPHPDIDPTGVQWRIRSYLDLWEELLAHHRVGRPLVIGIDGHSGSGKTTLANGLAALDRGTAVVHTDDLAWHHSFFGWADLLSITSSRRCMRAAFRFAVVRPPGCSVAEHRPWQVADVVAAGELGQPALTGQYGTAPEPAQVTKRES
jgi:hypothetical protein